MSACENPSTVTFAPGDDSVIVTENGPDGHGKISRLEIFSGKSKILFAADNVTVSDISPDGRWLLYNDSSTDARDSSVKSRQVLFASGADTYNVNRAFASATVTLFVFIFF